jgi:hypothetical protein
LSAYEALKQAAVPKTGDEAQKGNFKGKGKGKDKGKGGKGKPNDKKKTPDQVDISASPWVPKYLEALSAALLIATRYNVKPIKGKSLVFVNVDAEMEKPCATAKGFGKPMTFKGLPFLFLC